METSLKPILQACPFCGWKHTEICNDESTKPEAQTHISYWGYCTRCAAEGSWSETFGGAVEKWNMRAGDQQPTASETNSVKALVPARCSAAGMERAMNFRSELFDIANSYAGDETGDVAVMLHESCNFIVRAANLLEELRQNIELSDTKSS